MLREEKFERQVCFVSGETARVDAHVLKGHMPILQGILEKISPIKRKIKICY